jgi:hypothetical protein
MILKRPCTPTITLYVFSLGYGSLGLLSAA